GYGGAGRPPHPDEHSAVFIHRQFLRIDEVFFERFQCVVIELKAQFEDPIGQTLFPLQEIEHLCQDSIVVHQRPSTCASAASVCGSQKIISIDRYISMAVDNSVRACSRWPVVAYSMPRPRWQWVCSGRIPSSSARVRA